MVGPQTKGSLSITFEQGLILEIMQNMLGENPGNINEEVTDLVGEITNMVTGGAKNLLSDKGYEFEMATPVVVSGIGHKISHQAQARRSSCLLSLPRARLHRDLFRESVMTKGAEAPFIVCQLNGMTHSIEADGHSGS